jgi:hypothetical protein
MERRFSNLVANHGNLGSHTRPFLPLVRRLGAWVAVALTIGSCGLSVKPGSTIFSQIAVQDNSNSDFQYSLYSIDANGNETAYLGSLQRVNQQFEWPTAVLTDIGTRSQSTTAQAVGYIVKAYNPYGAGQDGDFYYEAPVLTQSPPLNGAATLMWWLMRYSAMSSQKTLSLSQNTLQNILFSLETQCSDCIAKSASGVLPIIQSNGSLQQTITSLWQMDSPQASLLSTVLANPPVGLAFSSPPLVAQVLQLINANQGDTLNLNAIFYDPVQSTTRLNPDTWTQIIGAQNPTVLGSNVPNLIYMFDFATSGNESFYANKTIRGNLVTATYNYTISIVHRPPVFSGVTPFWQVNHRTSINFNLSNPTSASIFDAQGLTSGISLIQDLSASTPQLSLGNSPIGVTLTNGILTWEPFSTQTGPFQIVLNLSDQYAMTQVFIDGTVMADSLPTIAMPAVTPWVTTEGQLATLSLQTGDMDGDPVQVTCTSGCSNFVGDGFPTAATGWPTTLVYAPAYNANAALESYGSQVATASFTPSFNQTMGTTPAPSPSPGLGCIQTISGLCQESSVPITLVASYPSITDPVSGMDAIRASVTGQTISFYVDVINQADTPVWTSQPTATINGTMNQAWSPASFSGGAALDPQNTAVTPLQPTAITYSISPAGQVAYCDGNTNCGFAANCSWFQINPATAAITLKSTVIPYTAAVKCQFYIRATDRVTPGPGLYADATQLVTINTTEVEVASSPNPNISPNPIPSQTSTEGAPFTLALNSYFADDNLNASDPNEIVSYTCSNCAALGIAGYSITTSPNGGTFTWTPPYTLITTAPYNPITIAGIQITADDNNNDNGQVSSQVFNLTVNYAPSPMTIVFSSGTITAMPSPSPTITITPRPSSSPQFSGTIDMNVSNAYGPGFPYTSVFSCSPNCRAGLVAQPYASPTPYPSPWVGTYPITITPVVSDGWGGTSPSTTSQTYHVGVTLTGTTGTAAGIISAGGFTMVVETASSAPNSILVTDAFGNNVTTSGITIDMSKWSTNQLNFTAVNAQDGTNDNYTYTTSRPTFGALTPTGFTGTASWTFNPTGSPNFCGSDTVNGLTQNMSFVVTATSSHGGQVSQTIPIAVINAATSPSGGGCPNPL